MSDDPDSRRSMAASLKALRTDHPDRTSTYQLAAKLGWSQAKVSRVERGATLPRPDEVAAWCRALGADSGLTRELLRTSEALTDEMTEWRRETAPGRRRLQQEIADLEQAASVIRIFAQDVVPGLVQTRRYAAKMFQLGRDPQPSLTEVYEAVEARMARQSILDAPGRRIEVLTTDTALYRSLLTGDGMREQLDRLAEVAKDERVWLGVIPFHANEHVHQYHSYAVLGDPDVDDSAVALSETVTRGVRIRSRDDLHAYVANFDSLAASALTGDKLVGHLREVSARAPWG